MIIPIFRVRDVRASLAFYTEVLDFSLALLATEEAPFYAVLTRAGGELHLNRSSQQRDAVSSATVVCEAVDDLFASFRARGLQPSTKGESPVHQGPLDQTWGAREVYVDDPDGNTICFQQR